jgi:chitinase
MRKFLLLVTVFLCFQLNNAVIEPLAPYSIVMYWGQNGAGGEPALDQICSFGYDIINLAFMISFIDSRQPTCAVPNAPDLNFAVHGNDCGTWTNCPFLLNCSETIGTSIKSCQSKGKKIVLSLGGAVGSYGFTSDSQAQSFAHTLWGMFFEGTAALRPFGSAVLDGVDLDVEGGSTVGYAAFVKTLRSLMSSGRKSYIISGAPQCPYPDAYLGPKPGTALGDAGSSFSYVSVQFYNNYCGLSSINDFWTSFKSWHDAATSAGYKVMVGLPASANAGGGYVPYSTVCNVVSQLKTYSHFGGFMFWDDSFDIKNQMYSQKIRQCLG